MSGSVFNQPTPVFQQQGPAADTDNWDEGNHDDAFENDPAYRVHFDVGETPLECSAAQLLLKERVAKLKLKYKLAYVQKKAQYYI